MMSGKIYIIGFMLIMSGLFMSSCQKADGDVTGSEYMPDMGHSVAYDANVYTKYGYNVWEKASHITRKEGSTPRMPVVGTIPRGMAGAALSGHASQYEKMMNGTSAPNAIHIAANGSVPYYYANTEEDRARAIATITRNPFPITKEGLEEGKELYTIYCAICHGEKADGNGFLVSEENTNAVYPAQPANFLSEEFITASDGRYYHSIMYGKNVMGSYADKLSYEERWDVIHWIRSLQAKEQKLEYSPVSNTFRPNASTLVNQVAPPIEGLQGATGSTIEAPIEETSSH